VDGDDEVLEEDEGSRDKIKNPDQSGTTNNCSRTERFYIKPPPDPTPSAPSNLNASDGTDENSVYITWNSVAGASHYRVFLNATYSTSGATALGDWQSGTAYSDTGAVPGQTYYYWVRAAKSSTGAYASVFSASDTCYRKIAVSETPQNVNASDGTYTDKVQITWDDISGTAYYRVY